MKKILGLDLGTTSIGWAVITKDSNSITSSIDAIGSRNIPTDTATINGYGNGDTVSSTKERTKFRSARRLRERYLLRRQRLFRTLDMMGYLPIHFSNHIDSYGHFIDETEPKLAWNEKKFIFSESFNEMLSEFKEHNPGIFVGGKQKIPYDWTIYYLRKKALHAKISKEELAWIILIFNKKRGYYQLREEDKKENKDGEVVEYKELKVISVEETDQTKKDQRWYKVHLENGWIYSRASRTPLDWTGKVKKFIVTTYYQADGTPKLNKDGEVKRSFRAPNDDDWSLLKIKSEADITASHKSVGEYIYDSLLNNPTQKIKGELVCVIERQFYKDELYAILKNQSQYHTELLDEDTYNSIIEDLYRSNDGYRSSIEGRDLIYLIVENILFYQRPLKTKKSLISDCKFEYYENKDGERYKLKSIAKSHPLYQEFRIWKFISNLKIYKEDVDITKRLLKSEQDYTSLFDWMNGLGDIDNNSFLKYKGFNIPRAEQKLYRWNYVIDNKKTYPCNQTKWMINNRLNKKGLSTIAPKQLTHLWHILYSVTDSYDIKKALSKFARKNNYDRDLFVDALKGCIFKREYGAYSQKAITKLLTLMRRGSYWSEADIDEKTHNRIENIINGEFDESIDERTRQKCYEIVKSGNISDFSGLDEWLASYVIYNRHSEVDDVQIWHTPNDIDEFLKGFKQHSLRNPIVEKVAMETLRVVRDLWLNYGRFDEIHIELAREMRQTKEERTRNSKRITENESTNFRIRKILEEFLDPELEIKELKPYSPSHQEIYKIYEELALSQDDIPDDIMPILDKFHEKQVSKQPTKEDIKRYKLWLKQQYRSPYTGEIIPLGKLFTDDYEVDHIIPRALYYDNSQSNKVICESSVNNLKGARLGMQFIKNEGGPRVSTTNGHFVTIYDEAQYLEHIDKYYAKNSRKSKNLKAEELPTELTSSQLNNTRYITKFIASKLSNIVREDGEVNSLSKNIIITSGAITDQLKRDWGLSDIWNRIVAPRFERLNNETESNKFGSWVCENGKRFFRTQMPLELSKGFSKKRIDHRHHAMDAIVIACTTRDHINYLNNLSSDSDKGLTRFQFRSKLCYKHKLDSNGKYQWRFRKPWDNFTQETYVHLKDVIVSFKQNLRILTKATNYYYKFENREKILKKQEENGKPNLAIRRSLHTAMPYGCHNYDFTTLKIHENVGKRSCIIDNYIRNEVEKIFLNEGSVGKAQEAIKKSPILDANNKPVVETAFKTSTRKFRRRQPITKLAARGYGGFKNEDQLLKYINKVADFKLREDLLLHLKECGDDIEIAFSIEGIEDFNSKRKIPVYKLPIAESGEKRFQLGHKRSNAHKWMEADSDTNLFFAIYQDVDGVRTFDSVPLSTAVKNRKKGKLPAPEINKDNAASLKYILSPNDLVYVPSPDQLDTPICIEDIDKDRIYKMVSCSKAQCFFIPANISYRIIEKEELGSNNKSERAWSGEMIKSICIPIKLDRLGRIIEVKL